MFQKLYLLAVIALGIDFANSWDIAITYGDQLEFYNNGTKIGNEGIKFGELTALAYDAVHNMLFFVDKQNDNASIFSYHMQTKKFQPLVKRQFHENIQGLSFDPITTKLFWIDTNKKSIYWISLAPGSKNDGYGNLLIKMDDEEIPRDIAVDSCRGYIYWTNTNITKPTIERARLDGSDRKTIIDANLYMPVSIAIDQKMGRLYWADDKEGHYYSIESSNLDGKDKKIELMGQYHKPNTLAVSKENIYWIEWGYNSVWEYPKHAENKMEPTKLISFYDKTPFGIVANYNVEDQTKDVPECERLANMAQNKTAINESLSAVSRKEGVFCLHGEVEPGKLACKCTPGYVGDRCEVSLCQNYCLQGDCTIDDEQPTCRCKNGYTGPRCEVDLCFSYCLNNGICSLNPVKETPVCKCSEEFEGQRCELKKSVVVDVSVAANNDSCNCTKFNASLRSSLTVDSLVEDSCDAWDPVRDPIMMFLGILCGVLCLVCAILITKIMHLKKRPRIKKRIIVNKNVTPLTARPDQCEITIENCCNMNICETPCFEPRTTIRQTLLDAKPGKEEKRNLISNMEHPDDF